MIRGVAFSRPLAAAAAVGWVSTAGAEWLRLEDLSQRARGERAREDLASNVSRQIAAKEDFDNKKMNSELRSAGESNPRLLSVDEWSAFMREIGAGWSLTFDPMDAHGDYSVQRATLRLRSPDVGDWPHIVAAVKAAEKRPGLRVLAIKLKAGGDQQRRSMEEAEIVLSIGWMRTPAVPTKP